MRSEEGAYLVDGPVLLAAALEADVGVRTVYVEADAARPSVDDVVAAAVRAGVRVREVVPGALGRVLDLGAPQSLVAVVDQCVASLEQVVDAARSAERPLMVLVDVSDPGNVGTLVRAAEAAGCAGAVLVGSCADVFNPKTVRATAGALFRVPVASIADLEELRIEGERRDVVLVGTVGAHGSAPEDLALGGCVAIVVGNEAHGLSADSLALCDHLLSIPMDGGIESLNVAVAGSVVAFEAARQRRSGPTGGRGPDRSGGRTTAVGHNDDPVASGRPSPGSPAPEHGSPPR